MATITSQEENDFIQQSLYSMTSEEDVWIGLTDEYEEGNWQWVTGENISYTNWAEGEPNNAGGTEHYGEFNIADGLWNDGRTDEDQLGTTYVALEEAMESGTGAAVKILETFNNMNSHKMNPIPTFKL